MSGCGVADHVRREAMDLEPAGFGGGQGHAVGGEQGRQRAGVRRRHDDAAARGVLDEVVHRGVGEDAALADDQQVIGDQLHLAHQVRGQQHRASLLGQFGDQGTDPLDAVEVEAVDGLVEDQHSRVGQQRRGDAQALAHPQRERAGGLVGHLGQADRCEHLVHASRPDADRGTEGEQVVAGAAAAVDGLGIEQRADLSHWGRRVDVRSAVDQRGAGSRPVQAEDHPHRRRLPGPVGTEEAGDDTRPDGGADAVDGELAGRRCAEVAVSLGELLQFNHGLPRGSFGRDEGR